MELVVGALRSLGRQADGRDALDGQHAERGHHHRQQRQGRPQAVERSRAQIANLAQIAWQISRDLGVGAASLKVVVIGDPYHQRDLSAPLEGPRKN